MASFNLGFWQSISRPSPERMNMLSPGEDQRPPHSNEVEYRSQRQNAPQENLAMQRTLPDHVPYTGYSGLRSPTQSPPRSNTLFTSPGHSHPFGTQATEAVISTSISNPHHSEIVQVELSKVEGSIQSQNERENLMFQTQDELCVQIKALQDKVNEAASYNDIQRLREDYSILEKKFDQILGCVEEIRDVVIAFKEIIVTQSQRLEELDEAIEGRLEKLEKRQDIAEHNAIVRVQNCHVASADDQLDPLFSLKTNKPIKKFPRNSAAIRRIDSAGLNAILTELGIDIVGTQAEKRRKLRVAIGLLRYPVEPA